MNQDSPDFINEQSFKEVFKLHYPSLCYYAYQFVSDKDIAKDLVQDAFVALWNQMHDIQNNEHVIKAYLYNAVKFICCKQIRHQKVVQRHIESTLYVDEGPDIHERIIRAEVLVEIHHALNSLPPSCKEIFILSYFDGLSNLKIAEAMKISVNTVKTQKQRGLKILRNILKPEIFIFLLILEK